VQFMSVLEFEFYLWHLGI